MSSLHEMAEKLLQNKEYRIFFHKKPDGDAIGSAFALTLALQSAGIKCEAVCCDPVPKIYHYLTEQVKNDELSEPMNISVDSASYDRLGKYSDTYINFCIDHHETNNMETDLSYIEGDASSCSEIIFKLIKEMGIPVTPLIADFLYSGLITDTYCFRSRNLTENSLRTASELAACGADIVGIARLHFMIKSPIQIEMEKILCDSFRYTCDGRVLGSMLTYDDYRKTGADDSELESLNAVVEQVDGVDIAIVVRETKPNISRVSIRTNGKYNASEICTDLGGGGHAFSAGCVINACAQKTLCRVEEVCAGYIKNNK